MIDVHRLRDDDSADQDEVLLDWQPSCNCDHRTLTATFVPREVYGYQAMLSLIIGVCFPTKKLSSVRHLPTTHDLILVVRGGVLR